MFRLIRLLLLLVIAFVSGVVHERGQARERCEMAGGTMTRTKICTQTGGLP